MKKSLLNFFKYTFYTILILLMSLNLVLTLVKNHIHDIHEHIADRLSAQLGGDYTFETTDIRWDNFTQDFRLNISGVSIQDSLYHQHRRPLMDIGEVQARLSFWTLLSDEIEVASLTLNDVELNLFVDSNGYSNKYLLAKKSDTTQHLQSQSRRFKIQDIHLKNAKVSITQFHRDKAIEFDIETLRGQVEHKDSLITSFITIKAHMHRLGFNLEKGAFLENQRVHIPNAIVVFDKKNEKLIFNHKKIFIDDQELFLDMVFDFKEKPGHYEVDVSAPNIDYQKGVAMTNRHLKRFLERLEFRDNIAVQVQLRGHLVYKNKPQAKALFFTHNNNLTTEFGDVKDVSLQGMYSNNYHEKGGNSEENSVIFISKFQGFFNDSLPLFSDSFLVYNLKNPYINAKIETSTEVENLQTFFGKSMEFRSGTADVKLHFKGHLSKTTVEERTINGHIKIRDADFIYHAKRFSLKNINVTGIFKNQDFILEHVSATKGESKFLITGQAENFLNAYFDNPELIKINLNLKSDYIDLNDLMGLAIHNSVQDDDKSSMPILNKPNKINSMSKRIDDILALGTMKLDMNLKKIRYNNFLAYNSRINVDFLVDRIRINRAELEQSDGKIQVQGEIIQAQTNNPFHIDGYIDEVDVKQFFYSMDDFKMQTLTHKNLGGLFSAKFSVDGRFTDKGEFLKKSLSGFLEFELKSGTLKNFGPLEEIGKYVLRKKHLDSIYFYRIHNHIVFENGKILIFPMSIQSSIIDIDLQGIYSFERGTDIFIHVPFIKEDKKLFKLKSSKFLSINLRAQDDENGQVKIGWDPRMKGEDNINDFNFRTPTEKLQDD